jgi:hypothetical protein
MIILGAIAGDEAVTIGVVKSQAGVFQRWSPALAPKGDTPAAATPKVLTYG